MLRRYLAAVVVLWMACGDGNLGSAIRTSATPADPASADDGVSAIDDGARAGSGAATAESTRCGDGLRQPMTEQCDGTDLGTDTCVTLGLGAGELGCEPTTCRFDTQHCGQDAAGPMPASPVPDAGGMALPDAGPSPGPDAGSRCPSGFECRVVLGSAQSPTCVLPGEASAPLCFAPGPSTVCTGAVPGSECVATTLGEFCLLECVP